jgi:hypothetical protein
MLKTKNKMEGLFIFFISIHGDIFRDYLLIELIVDFN